MKILAGRLPKPLLAQLRAAIGDWPLEPHAVQRLSEKDILLEAIHTCITTGRILEVNDNTNHLRALLRDANGVCVVVDYTARVIVTCYRNDPWDRHSTLRRNEYYWGQLTRGLLTRLTPPM